MKRSMKQAWLADLRANPDKQGIGCLTSITLHLDNTVGERDCCWGRLCKLVKMKRAPREKGQLYIRYIYKGEQRNTMPPLNFLDELDPVFRNPDMLYLDNDHREPLRDRYGNAVYLSGCNDSGLTFPQIADLIEYFIPEEDDDPSPDTREHIYEADSHRWPD